MSQRTDKTEKIETKPVIVTYRVYETEDEMKAQTPVGYFLVKATDGKGYILACGNILNERWDWMYASLMKDVWPRGMFRPTDLPVTMLPAQPQPLPPLPNGPGLRREALPDTGTVPLPEALVVELDEAAMMAPDDSYKVFEAVSNIAPARRKRASALR